MLASRAVADCADCAELAAVFASDKASFASREAAAISDAIESREAAEGACGR